MDNNSGDDDDELREFCGDELREFCWEEWEKNDQE